MNLNKNSILLKLFGLLRCLLLKTYYINSLKSQGVYFVGKGVNFYIKNGNVKLGKRVRLSDYVHLQAYGKLEIGDYTTLNSFTRIIAFDQIVIGSNCAIASFVSILDHDHDFKFKDGQIVYDGYTQKGVFIGNNVWIGEKVTILKGVTVGDNVVIGANSLVNRDIQANCLAVGNPCKVVRFFKYE